jgi:penicillin amidase
MQEYLEGVRENPVFRGILNAEARGSSNLWAVSGALAAAGRPIIANDPHLALPTPSTFYPMGLELPGEPVFGSSIAGTPGIIHGYNRWLAWGTTNNLVDVTDTFAEQVVPFAASPSGLATLYRGTPEPLIPIPQTFRANMNGTLVTIPAGGSIPPVTLVMPRRDGGPIISLDSATGAALSVQYVGFGPTQELEAFLLINRARNLDDFKAALQRMDVAQNFVYADVEGNIAYFTSGEIPVREDLQAGTVNGVPPWFVRNGQGGNEWLPVANAQPYQATAHEILPFSEHPQVVNPLAGYFVNGNNDPAGVTRDNNPLNQLRPGGGISYMAYSWNRGFRAARIEKRLRELLETGDHRVSFEEMQSVQADVVVRDGEVLAPYIVSAFDRPMSDPAAAVQRQALINDAVVEAIGRLRTWNGWTPTGLAQGYDESDTAGALQAPSASEVQASIAASIYAAWRSRILSNVINGTLGAFGPLPAPDDMDSLAALRRLFENGGASASGLNFFNVPGVASAADRRDIVILKSLREGLAMLASSAFFGSTNQNDYRWGLLHRVVFAHPLDSVFSLPPNGSAFSTDGGFQTVDASTHNARGQTAADFMFKDGPNHRTVVEARAGHMRAESIWPGGTSGVLGSPNYSQFLERWLANDAIPLNLGHDEVVRAAAAVEKYIPAE